MRDSRTRAPRRWTLQRAAIAVTACLLLAAGFCSVSALPTTAAAASADRTATAAAPALTTRPDGKCAMVTGPARKYCGPSHGAPAASRSRGLDAWLLVPPVAAVLALVALLRVERA
ncbi:hypothetical protein [Streptomyces flavofungini]|uniref:Lipoprotein n=1 Tax=Streptomyces flavofungini TaxID=68200 RepID=A0ABS0XGL1_9ACTN|nr:hypothetical protein [Streptomyces flavofungini]MBJ3812333.1 hypothetical protein [Streptomyces flavofungini]GHC88383.1 hypothetical protein GCM10010349_75630 [Streptomyces flavofungini]